jgi:hypothetical protein
VFNLLQKNSEGLLEVLETDFFLANKDKIDSFLNRSNPFPGFFATVTLDLMARTTDATMASSQD